MIKTHMFETTHDAYDYCQVGEHPETGEKISDGDVLVVASEGVVGILAGAWPAAVVWQGAWTGAFHEKVPDVPWSNVGGTDYSASVKLALETAEADADITGNPHWKEATA